MSEALDFWQEQSFGSCTCKTLFDMASVSKIIGPTMIAFRFLEEGLIRLYDPVSLFFPDAPKDKRDITILQLMTHNSGISDHFFCRIIPMTRHRPLRSS